MRTLDELLGRIIDFGLIGLVVFTPLAFGTVEEWSIAVAQIVTIVITAVWVLRRVWFTNSREHDSIRSGMMIPATLLVMIVVLQLVPLPASWIRVLSPNTATIFEQSLPGYPADGEGSFGDLPTWLRDNNSPEAGEVSMLSPAGDEIRNALPTNAFDVQYASRRSLSLTPAYTFRALQVLLAHLAMFFVAVDRFRNGRLGSKMLYSIAGLVGLLAIVGILQQLTAEGNLYWFRSAGGSGSFGPFVSHNNFAGWMEMALPITIGLAAWTWHRRVTAGTILLIFVSIVGCTSLIFSQSRGAVVALGTALLVVGIAVMYFERLSMRVAILPIAIVGVAIPIALWVGGSDIQKRYATFADLGGQTSLAFRWHTSLRTMEMARDFPILGTGLGTFEEAYALRAAGSSPRRLIRAHNDYAQLLAEGGIGAGIAMGWALVILFRKAIWPAIRGVRRFGRWPQRGACVGVIALLLHSFIDFNLQIYSNAALFCVLCAYLMAGEVATTASKSYKTRGC